MPRFGSMVDIAMERRGRGATGSRVVQPLILFFVLCVCVVVVFVIFGFNSYEASYVIPYCCVHVFLVLIPMKLPTRFHTGQIPMGVPEAITLEQ